MKFYKQSYNTCIVRHAGQTKLLPLLQASLFNLVPSGGRYEAIVVVTYGA